MALCGGAVTARRVADSSPPSVVRRSRATQAILRQRLNYSTSDEEDSPDGGGSSSEEDMSPGGARTAFKRGRERAASANNR